jgi:hypothetical protein
MLPWEFSWVPVDLAVSLRVRLGANEEEIIVVCGVSRSGGPINMMLDHKRIGRFAWVVGRRREDKEPRRDHKNRKYKECKLADSKLEEKGK